MNTYLFNINCPFQCIYLDTGETVIVDTEDFYRVKQLQWHLSCGYASTGHSGPKMHHFILGITDFSGQEVHHKDNNPLNNCKSNLQILSRQEHLTTRGKQSNNKSGYKGVSWKSPQGNRKGKWVAQISFYKDKIHLGYFDSPENAARAYDEKAKELFGLSATLNFPHE
jgi:hypothetical protein